MFSLLLYMLVNLCSSAAAKKDKKTRFLNQYDAFSMISKIHSCMLAQTMFVILFTSLCSLSAIDMPRPGPLITTQTCRRCWTVIPSGREEGMFSYFSKQTRVLHVTSLMFSRVLPTSSIIISLHVFITWQKIRHYPCIIITDVSSFCALEAPFVP